MSSSSTPLPTSRQLLTSLLNAIGDISVPPKEDEVAQAQGHTSLSKPAPANVLKLIHPSHRPLFTTLHVLFPSLLLPALDLLDRGLVTRLILERKRDAAPAGPLPTIKEDGPLQEQDSKRQVAGDLPAEAQYLYLVRSAQTNTARRPYAGGFSTTETPTGQAYIVHAEAWNCTCAAFAYAAFPPEPAHTAAASASGGKGKQIDVAPHGEKLRDEEKEECLQHDASWEFGGLSSDGLDGEGTEGMPCCKHLLACVLAERWAGGLGTYVVERRVTKEDMAGIVADV